MIYKHMVQKTNANITLLYVRTHTHICYILMMLVIAYNCLVYQLCISALRNSGCRAAGLRVAGDFLVPRGHLNAALCRELDGKAHRLSRVAVVFGRSSLAKTARVKYDKYLSSLIT